MYEIIGRLLSRERIRSIGLMLDRAGVNILPEAFVGFIFVLGFLFSLLMLLVLIQIPSLNDFFQSVVFGMVKANPDMLKSVNTLTLVFETIFSFLAVYIITILLTYVFLNLRIDDRKKQVENVLPDFLQLAAANVRAGMPIDQAMWYAAKPEFGLFSKEVEMVAKRTFGGEPFAQTLDRLAIRFDSRQLKRSLSLIKQGLSSGGEMAEILDRTATDARNLQIMQKEISASLLTYVIFIVFAAVMGGPFLFGVSQKLIGVLEYIFSKLPASSTQAMPTGGIAGIGLSLRPTAPSVGAGQFTLFAIGAMIVTSIFASIIIATISTGSKKNGVKYIPLFALASIFIYLMVSLVLDYWFAGILK
ncbi:Type II secretion system (T2SS), protein F [Candidatus Gugararchaeum adminiculabundum]|nr:Type II secretion system (T2SS), protein F [Candidatus Gugararchaeum adminiculabundum]